MRVTCGGWHRPFTYQCRPLGDLSFVHHQPKDHSTQLHCRQPQSPPKPSAQQAVTRDIQLDSTLSKLPNSTRHRQAGSSQGPPLSSAQNSTVDSTQGRSADDSALEGRAAAGLLPGAALGPAVAGLHLIHHGRETLCCQLLPAPGFGTPVSSADCVSTKSSDAHTNMGSGVDSSAGQLGAMCLLTGSEDGTVRRLLYKGHGFDCDSVQHQHPAEQEEQVQELQSKSHLLPGAAGPAWAGSSGAGPSGARPLGAGPSGARPLGAKPGAGPGTEAGFYGAEEIGFQAAGGAVKAVVAMPAGPGQSSSLHSHMHH